MRVILTEDVAHVGHMGDIVKVSDGYGLNYLIPQGLAVLATEQKTKAFEHQKQVVAHKKEKMLKEAQEIVKSLNAVSVTVARQAGDDDKLYGAVTNRDIQEALAAAGFEVDKRKIVLDKAIRELGVYEVEVKLMAGVSATIKVWVVAA